MTKNERIASFKKLQLLAEEKGFSVSRLAMVCGMSNNFMTYWKQGRSIPKADKMLKIARQLDISVEELLQ